MERYGEEAAMGGFIVVVDRAEWHWRDAGDDGRRDGPLGVWFDTRQQHGRRIVSGGIDVTGMVFEQLEIRVDRMATASHPNYELQRVWSRAGMGECRADTDTPAQARAESPPSLTTARITASGGSTVLQTDDDPELIYTVCPIFATGDLAGIARRFAAHLTSRSVRLEVVPPLPGIGECVAYAADADRQVGYRTTSGRRFPEYGAAVGTMQMRQGPSAYRGFLVVLDSAEWEREDGVCFVWVREDRGILVGRVGGGMRGVAERLGGVT